MELWDRFSGITESQLHKEFIQRLTAGRDLRVYITGNSETGVGKTTLAFVLAMLWDQHGWSVNKATLDPREFAKVYDEVKPGSVLILDEAEQAVDRRRSMAQETLDIGHAFATKRYQQVFGILTLPTRSWLDDRVKDDMCDYWIQCLESDTAKPLGEARVYRLNTNEHYETEYHTKEEVISWPSADWHPEFRKLQALKAERLEGETKSKYVPRKEVEELKSNYWNKASKQARYHIIKAMYDHGISQTDIASILKSANKVEGLSQPRVSELVNSDSFEEVYENA